MTDTALNDGGEPVVIVLDPEDDLAVQTALRDHCRHGSGKVLISPPSHGDSLDALARYVLAALRISTDQPRYTRGMKLSLDYGTSPTPRVPVQLPLFETPSVVSTRDWVRFGGIRDLGYATAPMKAANIRDLYVLRANALHQNAWSALAHFARDCEVCLHLVVHGGAPRKQQLAALRFFRVVSQPAEGQRPESPWWMKPSYRHAGSEASNPSPSGARRPPRVGPSDRCTSA